MNELDRVEAQALRDVVAGAGGRAELVGGAMCFAHPAPLPELSRALPIGAHVDVRAIRRWFGDHPHLVSVAPGYELDDALAAEGYEPGYPWMKFERDAAPAEVTPCDLRVEQTEDVAAVALVSVDAFGAPPETARILSGFITAPGFAAFVAWDGDEPAACGALYADGPVAWLGVGATRPAYRRRGAQSALLAARIELARSLGVRRICTETGGLEDGRPSQSYRNILRAGFREAYLRPNWRSV